MIQADLAKTSSHAAFNSHCVTCHIDHTQQPPAKAVAPYLIADPAALCARCHDTGEVKLRETHRGQPFAKARCTECHDPHGSSSAHLMRAGQHEPFAQRQCESCHAEPENGAVKLKKAAGELCLGCHAKLAAKIGAAPWKHTPLAKDPGACLDCHNPHASTLKALAKAPVVAMCQKCHAETGKKEFVHDPVKSDCTLCHDPHAGLKAGLRAESNALCLECHSTASQSKFEAKGSTLLFGGQVTLPPHYFQNLKLIDLNNDRGHPVANHPVLWKQDPEWPALSCTVCHNPHGADKSASLLVTESETFVSLCHRCHK